MTARHRLAALQIADSAARWEALGFALSGGRMDLGGVKVLLGAPGQGIVAWELDPPVAEIDGLPVMGASPVSSVNEHPNGAIGLDHVVIATPNFDRTARAFDDAGLPFRRIRDAGSFRQGFRRLGPAILEVVEAGAAPPGPARFWGLVVIVSDLQALGARLTEHLGQIKPAVQPGRHIATLRESAGLATKVAFMDPTS